jgi:hypothetical protein
VQNLQKLFWVTYSFAFILCLIPNITHSQGRYSESSVFVGSTLFNIIEYQNPKIVWDMQPSVQRDLNHAISLLDEKNPESALQLLKSVSSRGDSHWAISYYQGVSCNQLNKSDSAAYYFEKSIEINPTVPEVYLEYGKSLLFIRKRKQNVKNSLESARNQFKKAIEIDPNHITANLYLAGIELVFNNKKKVDTHLDKIESLEPKNYQALFVRAIILNQSDKNENLVSELLDQALTQKPDFVPALLVRISLYGKLKQPLRILEDLSTLIKLSPYNKTLLYLRGSLLIELKNYDQAYIDFKKILTDDTFQIEENSFDGNKSDRDRQIDWQECVEYQIRTISILPESEQEHIKKLICLAIVGQHKLAVTNFDERLQNESVNLMLVKALIYEQIEKHENAFELYNRCIAKDNSVYLAYKKRSIYLAELKDFAGAHNDIDQLEILKPYNPVSYKLRAAFYFTQNKLEESEKSYTKFLDRDSTSYDVYLLRALIREKTKKKETAFEDLHKYLTHYKDFTNYVLYKNLAIETKNQKKAIKLFMDAYQDEGIIGSHNLIFAAALLINLEQYDSAKKLTSILVKDGFDYLWKTHYESNHWFFSTPQNRDSNNPIVLSKPITEEFFYVQAYLSLHKKEYRRALESVDLVISYNPSTLEAKYIRAKINLEYQPQDAYLDLLLLKNNQYKDSEMLMSKWSERMKK